MKNKREGGERGCMYVYLPVFFFRDLLMLEVS